MISLALVRHAKSDGRDASFDDHDRPLNDRGVRDAPRMAHQLAAAGFRPDRILASTALRARTTAADFAAEFGIETELDPELYGAPAEVLLHAAGAAGVSCVLVVAHDPGMSVLAARLSDEAIAHMPTCAVATFTWDGDEWAVAGSVPPASWSFDTPR